MTQPDDKLLEGLPQLGEVLAGKYRLERVIGVGGMGVVMQATHVHLGEPAAIKFLSGEAAKNAERVARFTREAWAAAKIKSDHVARVSDVATLEDGTTYLVMEFLEGVDLEAHLQTHGALAPTDAIDFVLQACEALAEAHKLGIVHRDLKPGNLFVTHRADGSPWIKVLDFGISKITAGAANLTKTSSLMGSPLYMAPEQLASSKHVDARADIWSLGVMLYELLSGRSPYVAETLPQVITNVLHGQPEPLCLVAPHISVELERAVFGCLAKDPELRYDTLAEFASALAPHGSAAAHTSSAFISKVLTGVSVSQPRLSQPEAPPPAESQPQLVATEHRAPRLTLPSNPLLSNSATKVQAMPTPAATLVGSNTSEPVTGPLRVALREPEPKRLGAVVAICVTLFGVTVLAAALVLGTDDEAAAPAATEAPAAETAAETVAETAESTAEAPVEEDEDESAEGESSEGSGDATPQPSATASAAADMTTPPKRPRRLRKKKFNPWKGR